MTACEEAIVRIEAAHDAFIEDLQRNIPQEWEASEGSAESIVIEYVREIERRLLALGGSLDRCPEDTVPIIVTAVEIVNGAEVPIGEPRERTISRGALALMHEDAAPLPDRVLRAKLTAIAAEYRREPRWIRTQEVGKMLDDWLMG